MCKISNTIGEQNMNFEHSDKTKELLSKIQQFMDDHLYEGEKTYHQQHEEMSANGKRWEQPPILDELKAKAKKAGLWGGAPRKFHEQSNMLPIFLHISLYSGISLFLPKFLSNFPKCPEFHPNPSKTH